MDRFKFEYGWSRRIPEHEGHLCRVLEISAPRSLLEYGGAIMEIEPWLSLAFWRKDDPETMTEGEVLSVDEKLERMAHTLLIQRAASDVVILLCLGTANTLSR